MDEMSKTELQEWLKQYGTPQSRYHMRVARGWKPEKAIKEPKKVNQFD